MLLAGNLAAQRDSLYVQGLNINANPQIEYVRVWYSNQWGTSGYRCDWGQERQADSWFTNPSGQQVRIKSTAVMMNYMHKHGWEFVSSQNAADGKNRGRTHYYFRRRR